MADKTNVETLQSSQSNNPLSKKLNKILETRLENDKEILEALKSLSIFFTENNLRSRRNLRGDIERRSLTINEEFVDNFRLVKEQLDDIYNDVVAMNDCCQDMTSRLKAAKAQTHDLIHNTTQLQAESQKLSMRASIVDTFLEKFQLKASEVQVLRGTRDGALHPDFFSALTRVRQIHNDCKVLLRTNQQTAGLEIMESMALHQEAAFERLYRWAQNECRSLTNDSPDVSSRLCQAMVALQDRPILFKFTLDEFGTARRTAIVRGFIDALTRGGPGGTPRPMELHAHDPLRYTGDMLGWLHQAAASEREHVTTLLRHSSGSRGSGSRGSVSGSSSGSTDTGSTAIEAQITDTLSHITEGVCRPFKVRVEQVLVSDPGALVLYKIANLLKFYHNTIGQLVTPQAALLATLDEMHTLGLRMFFSSLTHNANKLLEKVELPPADLGPTMAFQQTLQLLQDVLSSHDSSVIPLEARKQDFAQILSCMVEPLLQLCSVSASRLSTVDMATYMLNCLHLLHTTLALYEFTEHRLEMLQAQVDAHVDTLVSEQAGYMLQDAGLAAVYGVLQQHDPNTQGPLVQLLPPDKLKHAMSEFDKFLASPDSTIMPQCSMLLSSKLRELVRKRSMELICQAFQQMYQALLLPENKYTNPRALVPRTPDQVTELLL